VFTHAHILPHYHPVHRAPDHPLLKPGRRHLYLQPGKLKGRIQFIALRDTLQDITQRKQTEVTLAKSEESFRLAMEATDDGLWD
jgi:PAS domain-containing protein